MMAYIVPSIIMSLVSRPHPRGRVTGREKGCGLLAVRYVEVKLYWEARSGPTNLSVIVNWEFVHSLEVRNVLSLWQIQSVP